MLCSLRRNWDNRLRIVSADSKPAHLVTASLLSDRHRQTPPLDSAGFAGSVGEILDAEGISDYVPLNDRELLALEHMPRPSRGVAVWACDRAAGLTRDKNAAYDFLDGLGIPTPRRLTVADIPTNGHAFVKPRRGNRGQGTGLMSARELRLLPAEALERLILQEPCATPEVTVDSFHDKAGGRHRSLARERLTTRSGVCVAARIHEDPLLDEYAWRIGEALEQRGTICFQAMRGPEGWLVTDLNLRPGAGTAMTAAVGVDLLAAMAACRWDEPVEPYVSATLPADGVHVTRQYSDHVMP